MSKHTPLPREFWLIQTPFSNLANPNAYIVNATSNPGKYGHQHIHVIELTPSVKTKLDEFPALVEIAEMYLKRMKESYPNESKMTRKYLTELLKRCGVTCE